MKCSVLKKVSKQALLLFFCFSVLLVGTSCQAGSKEESKPAVAAATAAPAATADTSKVMARVGNKEITEAELRKSFRGEIYQAENEYYTAMKRILDRKIEEYLMEQEAKRKGITLPVLIQKEIEQKAGKVSGGDVQKFYDENKRNPSFPNVPLADLEPKIREHLQAMNLNKRRQEYLDKLRGKAGVSILMTQPSIEVAAGNNPARGPKEAPIQIIQFSDFQCPFCSRAEVTMEQVWKKYPGKIHHVFRDFPLNFHQQAHKAAEAAECANEQGKFWNYRDLLFKKEKGQDVAALKEYAKQLKLDSAKFDPCLDSGKFAAAVDADMKDGQEAGVSGVPAFFINGRMIAGARPLSDFTDLIDTELKRLKK